MSNPKIEALQDFIDHAQWFGRLPYKPCSIVEAVTMVESDESLVIARVSWWGSEEEPLPAGLTWLEVLEEQPGGYRVLMDTEPRKRENLIPADEVVLIFWK